MKLYSLFAIFFVIQPQVFASDKLFFSKTETKYVIHANQCPKLHVGKLALSIIKDYESGSSLLKIKEKLMSDGSVDKYFLRDYHVDYNPIAHRFHFQFECPRPLLKAQIYDKKLKRSYMGILGDQGEMMDPSFEVILRQEGMLNEKLPYMAINWEDLVAQKQLKVVKLLDLFPKSIRTNLSEVILNSEDELTLILKTKSKGLSVFLGDDSWDIKLDKLTKVLNHFEKLDRMPALVNLASTKKVVVKFTDGL
ncbi:MAG: cell division protein FtsQ/DivIB [Bacteriovoracaceae bacterium]|nr:cell division protein FtsQ/DivIB [Bacteriovoracaceae bacterium]